MKLGFKKLSVIGVLSIFALSPLLTASAAVYLPESITLPGNPTTATSLTKATVASSTAVVYATYDAGTTQKLDVVYSEQTTSPNSIFEYGVVRLIKQGNLTYFETLSSTKEGSVNAKKTIDLLIPNVTAGYASSTYAGYVKTYVKDDPDSEHFYLTKSFAIKANAESPLLNIRYSNLLQSTGKRFVTQAGPSIYNPAKEAAPNLATSTSLEITFESNQDTTIHPILNFSMLRTGSFTSSVDVGEIAIKKGETHIVIPLPTFDYKPGVYVGSIDFKSELLKNTIDFQYIVAGDIVTVGQTTYKEQKDGSLFTYNIYGTPLDIDRIQELRNKPKNTVYSVVLSYVKNGKEVYKESKDVDFGTSTFSSLVPSKVKKIDQVNITVTSKTSNEVVYSGTKDLYVERAPNIIMNFVISLIILLAMILILAVFKKHHDKTIVAVLFFLVLLGFVKVSFAWEPSEYATYTVNAGFSNENVYENPRMFINEDISAKTYSVGAPLTFLFKLSYVYCSNTGVDLSAGLSKTSVHDAIAQNTARSTEAESATSFENGGNHTIYRNITSFIGADLGFVQSTTTHVYAVVVEDLLAGSGHVQDGSTIYEIPIHLGPAAPEITAQTSAQCGGKIDLAWSAVTGATAYDIYRSVNNGTYTKVGSTASPSYNNTVGAYGQTFYYKVKSIGVSGAESGFSNAVSATSSAICDDKAVSFSCSANPVSVGLGKNVDWSVSMQNDSSSNYTYQWTGAVNSTLENLSTTYSSEGGKYATVVATNKTDTSKRLTANCYTDVTSDLTISCNSGENYCSSLNKCVGTSEACPASCGPVSDTNVPADAEITSATPGLCGGSYSLLPGSLFTSLGGGNTNNAWRWTCSSSASGGSANVSCSANCSDGTTYCPTTNTCSTECDICPDGFTANNLGECIAPNASITYFRASPDTSSTTCPGFWDTTVTPSNKAHLDCKIGTTAVNTKNVIGSTGYALSNGTLHTLSCDLLSNKTNTFIKTIASSTRCYKNPEVIEH